MALSDEKESDGNSKSLQVDNVQSCDDSEPTVAAQVKTVDGTQKAVDDNDDTVPATLPKTTAEFVDFARVISAFASSSGQQATGKEKTDAATTKVGSNSDGKARDKSSSADASNISVNVKTVPASRNAANYSSPSGSSSSDSTSSGDMTDNRTSSSSSSSVSTLSDNDSLPALVDYGSARSGSPKKSPLKQRAEHAKKAADKAKSESKADDAATSSSSKRKQQPCTSSGSSSGAGASAKVAAGPSSGRRHAPKAKKTKSISSCAAAAAAAADDDGPPPLIDDVADADADSDEPPPLINENRRKKPSRWSLPASSSSSSSSSDADADADTERDGDTNVERVVARQMDSMLEAIEAEHEPDEVDEDDEWDTAGSSTSDESDHLPEGLRQMMLDAIEDAETDSSDESDEISDNSDSDSAADGDDDDNRNSAEAADHVTVVTVDASNHATLNVMPRDEADVAVAAAANNNNVVVADVDDDGMPALEDPDDAATERARRVEALRRTRAQFAHKKRRTREAHKTPPDSDYENITKLDVVRPYPHDSHRKCSYGANLAYKLFAKESQNTSSRRCSAQSFGENIYGSLFSARKMELMRKLGAKNHEDRAAGHTGCVNACNFSDDGTLLVSGADDLQVCLWDWAASAVCRAKFSSGHRANVFQTKFLPYSNNSVVITCSRDGQVRLAELSSDGKCKETRLLGEHADSAHKLAMRRDNGSQFYSCGEDGYVKHYDLRDSRPSRDVVCVRNSTSKRRSSGGGGSSSSLHNDSNGEGDGGDGNENVITLYSIDCNPLNNNEFLVSGVDDAVRIYDLRYLQKVSSNNNTDDADIVAGDFASSTMPVKTFCPAKFRQPDRKMRHISASCAVYDWNGSNVLVSYNDHNIFEFDNRKSYSGAGDSVHNDAAVRVFRGHRNRATVKGVNYFGPRSEFVVSGSDCGNVFLWHRETQRVVNMLAADEQGVVNVLECHPTAPVLATSGLDHDIKIWVPSNESPKLNTDRINRRARKNIKERKDNEKRPALAMPSGFMAALLQHLNSQRARGGAAEEEGEEEEEADPNEVSVHMVRGGDAATERTRRQRRRRRRPRRFVDVENEEEEEEGENNNDNNDDDDEDEDADGDGDSRPIRCDVS